MTKNTYDKITSYHAEDREQKFSAILLQSAYWTSVCSFLWKRLLFLDGNLKVVAFGTGTSCLGFNQTCDKGRLIHDSHAEVVARRAFTRLVWC